MTEWPADADADLHAEVHRLLADVVAAGGSVGWAHVPDEAEAAGWFEAELALVRAGRAAVALLRTEEGGWPASPSGPGSPAPWWRRTPK